MPATFEDTSSPPVDARLWDFGDGTTSTGRIVEHAWSAPGFYDVTLTVERAGAVSTASLVVQVEASRKAGTCEADAETLCLADSRYRARAEWWTVDGRSGMSSVIHAGTNDSGVFSFFGRNNWEILIKVLDGCDVNGHVWVFGAATTDMGCRIEITDTLTGEVREYRNESGNQGSAINDTVAFADACGAGDAAADASATRTVDGSR